MDVLVVGAGDVGRWFGALADAPVTFTDVDEDRARAAAEALDRRASSVPLDTEESFGLVAVAVPLGAATAAIERHANRAEQAVVDFTGSMEPPLRTMAQTAPARERASFHPLFAPAHAPGRVAVSASAPGPATDRVRKWLEDAGNDLVEVQAEVHDEAMETIQGRAHAAVLAFALAADDVPAELATPVFESLTELTDRVTDGNARVYEDIQAAFGGAAEIAEAAERIADATTGDDAAGASSEEGHGATDGESFAEVFEDAGR
jgi:prephenate dehydrogenase